MKTTIAVFGKTGREKEIASLIEDAEIIDISEFPSIPEDTERLGIICPTVNGNVPYEVEDYIRNEIGERDNNNLKYIFGILTYDSKPLWVESQLSRALSDAGCVLTYVDKVQDGEDLHSEKMNRIVKDIANEEFKLAKYSLLYRIFRRFGRNRKPVEN